MIYHDDGHGGLTFFQKHRHLIGEIKSVAMSPPAWAIKYPFKVIGEMGEVWLSYWGHVPAIMEELGYPREAVDAATKNSEFEFGPPKNWKPKVVQGSGRRITESMLDSAQEVLSFIETYHYENDNMPTAREIASGCDSVSGPGRAHHRLRMLQEQGHIHVERRKHRGITLL